MTNKKQSFFFFLILIEQLITPFNSKPFKFFNNITLYIHMNTSSKHSGETSPQIGMTIGPRPYGYLQKIPTMDRVKSTFMNLGTGPGNTHTY